MPDDKKKTLYNNLVKEGYDLPDYNTFVSDMTDETKRTKFHSSLVSEGYDIPDYKTFSVDMGFDSQKKNQIVNEGQPSGNIGSLASSRSGLQSNITNRQPVVVEQQAVPHQIDGIPKYDFTGKSGVAIPQTSTQYDIGVSELKSDKEKAQALRDLKVNKNINNQIIDVENQLQQEKNGFIQTPGLAQELDLSIAGKNVLGTPTERKLEALKQEKQRIIDDYGTGEYLYDKLVSGMSNLWKSVVETPAFVYNLAAVPQNIIANYTGIPIGTSADEFGKMMGIENNVVADYYGNIINEVKQKSQEKFNTSIEQSIKDGRFTDALTQLGGSILESAPITMSIMAGNASGLTTAESIFGFGTMFAANNYAELNANPATANLPESVKMSNAIVNGLFEGIFEQFGVTKLGSIVKGMIKGKAKEEAVKISKDAFKQVYGKLFARYFGIAGEEALTEGMTQFSQNISDKYYGVDPERDIFDGVVDAMIIGGFAGGIYTTPLMGNELYVTKKIREESKKTNIEKKALEQDLISDNIPIQEKAVISQRIQDINEIEAQRYDEAKNIVKDLTDEQKKEVGLMLNEIQQVEKTIENPNISDATKESLQQKVDEKQKQIDKLISEVEQRLSQPIKEEVKDDSKDITGVSGGVGVGEKPVETKPVAKTGEEKISDGRMVQEEATPELDVTIEKISKAVEGKDISPDVIEEAAALVQEGLAGGQDVFDVIEKAKSEPELKAELDNIEAEVGSDIPQSEVKQTEPPATEKLPIGGSKKIGQPTGQAEIQKPAEQAPVEVKQETKVETKQEATAEIGTPKYKSGGGQLVGKKKNKTIANGEKIEGQYKIVSADDIVASHNEVTFSQSDNFPKNKEGKTINDRDYQQDSNAQKQVILIADKLDDRALHQTPIVSKDGIVLDGNNRTMSRKLAAKNGTDSDYIKALKENADMYGIENTDAIDNIKNPILVFEASKDMPYDTKTYSKFNVTEKKEKSPIEKAIEISKTITDSGKRKLFKIFEQSKGTFSEITSKTSNIKDIVNMFLSEGLLQQNELPRYFDTERLTATSSGIELLRSTLLGSAINENTIRALDADNMGDIRNKILSSIVDLVKNNSLKNNSLSSNIEKGIEIVNRAKKAGLTLEDWASQIDMFDQLKFDAIDLAVAIKLEGRFTEFIRRYNEDVDKTEFDFETGKPTIRTKENIIEDILIKEINNYEKVKRNIKELGQQGEGKADKNIKNDKQQGEPIANTGNDKIEITEATQEAKDLLGDGLKKIKVGGKEIGAILVEEIDGVKNVVKSVFIKEELRGKGIGTALYEKLALENGEIVSGEFRNDMKKTSFVSDSARALWDKLSKKYQLEKIKIEGDKFRYRLTSDAVLKTKDKSKALPNTASIPKTVRELSNIDSKQEGLISGAFFSTLKKGDTFTIGKKNYEVTQITKAKSGSYIGKDGKERKYTETTIRIKDDKGNTISGRLRINDKGNGNWYGLGQTKNSDRWGNLSRDIEGDITLDLVNEYNKFHEKSDSYKRVQKYIDEFNNEQFIKDKAINDIQEGIDGIMNKIGGKKNLLPEERTSLVEDFRKIISGVTDLTVEELREFIRKSVLKFKEKFKWSDKDVDDFVNEVVPEKEKPFTPEYKDNVKDVIPEKSAEPPITDPATEPIEQKEPKLSGIKKALVPQNIIDELNLEKVSDKELLEIGKKLRESGEVKPREIVDEIVGGNYRALQPKEVVALINYKVEIDNRLDALYEEIVKRKEDGTPTDALKAETNILEQQKLNYEQMSIVTAQQQSLAFRLRRYLLDNEYNVQKQIYRYKANSPDGKIPKDIEDKFIKLGKQLRETEKQLKEAETRALEAEKKIAEQSIKDEAAKEKKQKTISDKAKFIADNIRKGKIVRPEIFMSATPASLVWDGALEVVATTIERSGLLIDAISKGISHIKNSDWYKGLDKEKQKQAIEAFTSSINKSYKPKEGVKLNEEGQIEIPKNRIKELIADGYETIEEWTDIIHKELLLEYPDITEAQVRDAITGYGKIASLTKDEVEILIQKQKSIGRLISALEDVQIKKQNPKRTGKQRRSLEERERKMMRQIREEMKNLPQSTEEINQKWKSILDKRKAQLRNDIESIERQIKEGKRDIKEKKGVEYDDETRNLVQKRDELKEELDRIDPIERKGMSDEDRVNRAITILDKQIESLDKQISEGDLSRKLKARKLPETPELKAKRELRNEKKKQLDDLREQAGIVEKERLERVKKNVQKRIETYKDRIINKDFAKKEKKKILPDNELIRLNAKLGLIKEEFEKEQYLNTLKNRSAGQKVRDIAVETFALSRIIAGIDMSFVGIQGLIRTATRPKQAAIAFVNAMKSMVSDKAYEDYIAKLKTTDLYRKIEAAKGYIAKDHYKFIAREEQFQSGWANILWDSIGRGTLGLLKNKSQLSAKAYEVWKKLNPYKAGQKAFDTYMNYLRIQAYSEYFNELEKMNITPENSPETYKAIGSWVNNATGRGKLIGSLDLAADLLTIPIFSPRKVAANFNVINPRFYWKMYMRSPVAAKMAMKNMLQFLGVVGTTLGIASMSGDDDDEKVNYDPRSSNFLKIKVGDDKYIDILAGHSQVVVMLSRLVTGKMINQDGKVTELNVGYNAPTRKDIVGRFFEGKASPSMSLLLRISGAKKDVDTGKLITPFGEELTLENELIRNTVPIWMQQIKELYKEGDPYTNSGIALLMMLGFNVSVKKQKISEGRKEKTGRKDKGGSTSRTEKTGRKQK